jgi:hypothetical protein
LGAPSSKQTLYFSTAVRKSGGRLAKHSARWNRTHPRIEIYRSCGRPSSSGLEPPASVDAGMISGMAVLANGFRFASRVRLWGIARTRQDKPSLTFGSSRLRAFAEILRSVCSL